MHKNILTVVGVTILFLGTCITPSVANDTVKKSIDFPFKYGLLAYWKSDECDGTTLWDCSGHNYDGTIYANWTYGGCLVFNGIDDYVDFNNHSENLGLNKTDDYLIRFNFKSTSNCTGSIYSISHTDSARAFAYLDLNANGTLSFKIGDKNELLELYTMGSYNDGSWHDVVVKFYGRSINPTVEIYVDGYLDGSITDWSFPFLSEDFKTAKIGRKSSVEIDYFDGVIDEFKIYKYGCFGFPRKPVITGPSQGKAGESYTFTFTSTDGCELDLIYEIDWGDGTAKTTSPQMESGETFTAGHTWSEKGTYTIKATATNIKGAPSQIGQKNIEVPRTRAPTNQWFLQRFPMLERLLSLLL